MSANLQYGFSKGRPEDPRNERLRVARDHVLSKQEIPVIVQPTIPAGMKKSLMDFQRGLNTKKSPKYLLGQRRVRSANMKRLGLDIGTKNIVLSYRDGQAIKFRYETNGYLIFDKVDQFLEQLLVKQGVPFISRGKEIIAIGGKAENLAYVMNRTLSRPMAEGGINKWDEDAQEIVAIIIKSIIGKLEDDAVLYYCTTAQPVGNTNINIEFHKKVVKLIIESYVKDRSNIVAEHINEGRCLVIEEQNAAIGISWGAGTITVHAGIMGVPIFEFCVVGAGDWIDIEAAKRFGYDPEHPDHQTRETPTSICRRKEKLNLNSPKEGLDRVDQAIVLMYEILVENVVAGIVKGFKENRDKFKFSTPVPVINAGGTSIPEGFIELFSRKFLEKKDDLQIPIGDIKKATDPLFAVSRGCLIAAEMHK